MPTIMYCTITALFAMIYNNIIIHIYIALLDMVFIKINFSNNIYPDIFPKICFILVHLKQRTCMQVTLHHTWNKLSHDMIKTYDNQDICKIQGCTFILFGNVMIV